MTATGLTIRDVTARAIEVPLRRPLRTAVGSIPIAPLVLIDLLTEEGVPGRAYLFAYTRPALAPLARLIGEIAPELRGRPVAPLDRQRELDRRFRLVGRQGLIGMALSGLDMALWDVLARAQDQPLVALLGAAPRPLPAYDSFGMIDPAADEGELRRAVEAGFAGIKIKIGGGSLADDVAAVRAVRSILGPEIALMVDYNQSLDPVEAGRRIARLAAFDLHWVEEPVAAEDLAGHARVRAAADVPIQTGENWWFPRGMADAIAAGASDLAMLDVMKIGGVTGWMQAAALADAAALPVSSHIFVEASAHLLAATPTAHWLEHLDLAGPILADPPRPVAGRLVARGPGLGLDWDEAAVARLQADRGL
jgi:mandelate racemase